jgi:hypothetical protein
VATSMGVLKMACGVTGFALFAIAGSRASRVSRPDPAHSPVVPENLHAK